MINGYEEIYGIHNKKNKKYEVLDSDKTAHNIWNCLTKTHLGISTTEAYISIVEQQIGQDEYKALISAYGDYDSLMRGILEYQEKVDKYRKTDAEKKSIEKQISDKKAQIDECQEKMDDLLENGNERTARMDIRDEHEKFRTEIARETDTINELTSKRFYITENLAILKPQIRALKNYIMQQYERLIASSKKLENINLDKFYKFNDADFEAEIQQDFIDSRLLQGEEKKEDLYRKMADAKFQMMKMEATYLIDAIDASKELLEELRDNQLKMALPQEIMDRHSTLDGMNYASTVMLMEFDYAFTQEAFNDYYLYMADLFKNMNYGANWVEGAEKYYKTGVEMGIPDRKSSPLKHKLGEMTGKIKVRYGYDMDMLNPIVWAVGKMKGGVKFDFDKQYGQETGLSK